MPDIFAPVVRRILDLGFGNVFVFVLTMAVMYALLKKSKILGESDVVSGSLAVIFAFMISFAFPVLTGMTLVPSLSLFFTQTLSIFLFLIVGFLGAAMFYPDLGKLLQEQFKHRASLWVMLVTGIALFITSGLVSTLWSAGSLPKIPGASTIGPPTELLIIAAGLILFIVILVVASAVGLHRGD